MKYRVGDKVKIKTWEQMKKEFGLTHLGSIKGMPIYFTPEKEESIKLYPDRILTIDFATDARVFDIYGFYYMEGMEYKWFDQEVEGLAGEDTYPINDRFEILDL